MAEVILGGVFPISGEEEQYTPISFPAAMLNRHGLISGATGTGKTVTLQVFAEELSRQGVSVFTADVKGDLSGIAKVGKPHSKIDERVQKIGLEDYSQQANPTAFWDLYQKKGVALRTTVSEMGPLLFSHILDLNDVQSDVVHLLFRSADEQGLLLLDLKDFISLVDWVSNNRAEFSKEFGNVASQTLSAIKRRLHVLEDVGGDKFFGEPAFTLHDLLQTDFGGRGLIHVLDATELILEPRLYSAFLVWLLSELFEELEEYGDADKPRLVFFFDEAHLLFSKGSKGLLEKFETVVRLIRSKGVGVFFVTQNPLDVPESVRGQLGAKVQHALRAHSVKEKKAVRVLSENFVENPNIDVKALISSLGTGEALVSCLNKEGIPQPVEHVLIRPPRSLIGPISKEDKEEMWKRSAFASKYSTALDRESAYEVLEKRTEEILKQQEEAERAEAEQKEVEAEEKAKKKKSSGRQGIVESFIKSVTRTIGYQVGKHIVRGVLGSMTRK